MSDFTRIHKWPDSHALGLLHRTLRSSFTPFHTEVIPESASRVQTVILSAFSAWIMEKENKKCQNVIMKNCFSHFPCCARPYKPFDAQL